DFHRRYRSLREDAAAVLWAMSITAVHALGIHARSVLRIRYVVWQSDRNTDLGFAIEASDIAATASGGRRQDRNQAQCRPFDGRIRRSLPRPAPQKCGASRRHELA